MANKKTMVICHDWLPLFKSMEPDDVCRILFALMEYDVTGEAPQITFDNRLVEALYQNMLSFVVDNRTAYLETCRKRSDNAKQRWTMQEHTNAYKSMQEHTNAHDNDNDTDNDIDNENDIDIDNEAPPTLAQIKAFLSAENLKSVNPDVFFNYYQSMHWTLDGKPMDWKARARWWNSNKRTVSGFNDFKQREQDWNKLEKDLLKK